MFVAATLPPARATSKLTDAEIISHTVWLYFRFPLSLHMMDELLATCGIIVSHG